MSRPPDRQHPNRQHPNPQRFNRRLLDRSDLSRAQSLLQIACQFDAVAPVAEEKLFEPALQYQAHTLAAESHGRLLGLVTVSGPCIRLLAVHPDHRRRGVGSALLTAAETAIALFGAPVVRILDQPGNYLAPGIDQRNQYPIRWLQRRGYAVRRYNTNLLVDVRTNPLVTAKRARALANACPQCEIRRARPEDAPAMLAAIEREFAPGWAFEVAKAMACNPPGVHLAIHRNTRAIAGFAAHDGNNRSLGWFGPAGVWPAYRRHGLGAALLCACLVDVAAAGVDTCEIAWIGPRAFYARAVGIVGERRFAVLRKDLP